MKKYLEGLKTLWGDERGRALIKLGAYIIFIIIAVIYARSLYYSDSTSPNRVVDVMQKFQNKQVYTENVVLNGSTYFLKNEEIVTFSAAEKTYSIVDDKVFLLDNDVTSEFPISFWKMTPKVISELIKGKKTFYVTSYEDGTKDKAYQFSLAEFITKFEKIEVTGELLESENTVIVVLHEATNEIDKVVLDLSSYYRYLTNEIKEYKIEIHY